MKVLSGVMRGVVIVTVMCAWGPAAAQVAAPDGDLIARNLDIAAERAFKQWIDQLASAPNMEGVQNIGIIALGRDTDGFTEILAARLSAQPNLRVVVLRGGVWNAIEDALALQDPNDGLGDIMDKATILWREVDGEFLFPETAVGAHALLIGRVRGVDRDWLRARTRFVLELARMDTRTMVAGGIVEGESRLSREDLMIYYKTEMVWGIVGVIVAFILLTLFLRFIHATKRVR